MAGVKLDFFPCKSELGFLWKCGFPSMFWLLFTYCAQLFRGSLIFGPIVHYYIESCGCIYCSCERNPSMTKWTTATGFVVIRTAEISILRVGFHVIAATRKDQTEENRPKRNLAQKSGNLRLKSPEGYSTQTTGSAINVRTWTGPGVTLAMSAMLLNSVKYVCLSWLVEIDMFVMNGIINNDRF